MLLTISVCSLHAVAIECNNDKSLVLALLPCLTNSMCRHSQFKVFQVLYITVTEKAYYNVTI